MLVLSETRIYACLLLLLVDISTANLLTDIPKHNPLNIDWDPAPSPEDGPPLSAHASRNKALLPAQISGIVGAYLICVCILGIGLFCIGRKNRRNLLLAEKALDIEMLESRGPPPINTQSPPLSPPLSPRNFSRPSWPAQEKGGPTPYIFPGRATSPRSPTSPYSPQTPRAVEHPNVDTRIVERDQHMLQRDLEDIYAHVMEQEEAKKAGVPLDSLPLPSHIQPGPIPRSPPQPHLSSPSKKIEKRRPSNITLASNEDGDKPRSRSSSIISALLSPKKSKPKMRISSPMASPRWQETARARPEEEEPLTPRYYAPAPPPPVPTDQAPSYHTRQTSDLKSPTKSIAEHLGASPYHRANISQTSNFSAQSLTLSQGQGLSRNHSLNNSPIHEAEPDSAVSANSSTPFASYPSTSQRTLPLRQFEPALTSPSYSSFATTKTTMLERTERPGGNGPRTGGLTSGWASPGAVPYSPYQPFTPMIPITPRLVTKEERKMKEKMEKKHGKGQERELVKSEDELWDSGY